MQIEATNRKTLPRAYAPMAIPIALSLALMAFLLMMCGCTVREEPQPNGTRRHVDVNVDVDVHRRPCPDGRCPLRRAGCDCGCPVGDCDCTQCNGGWGRSWPVTTSQLLQDDAGQRCPGEPTTGASPRPSLQAKGPLSRGFAPATSRNPKSKIENRKSEHPVMNLPEDARCKNYNGGSCVCASTISLLRWQGRDDLAAALRSACSGGQSSASLHAKLERLGVRYASTTSGDVAFLEWAVRTRRGCGITYYPMHFVNLVDLTAEHATLLDNNRVGQYINIPRDEFLRRWRGFGGWATAVVYSPAAPVAKK